LAVGHPKLNAPSNGTSIYPTGTHNWLEIQPELKRLFDRLSPCRKTDQLPPPGVMVSARAAKCKNLSERSSLKQINTGKDNIQAITLEIDFDIG
jgi:hypothetical protein